MEKTDLIKVSLESINSLDAPFTTRPPVVKEYIRNIPLGIIRINERRSG
jgi:hypothetical protein